MNGKNCSNRQNNVFFGYVTATFATYFIGRDAEEKDAPIAGSREIEELKSEIIALRKVIEDQTKD